MSFRSVKLGDLASMKYGKMPPKDLLAEDGFPIFSGYRVTGFCKEFLYEEPRVVVVARGVGGTGDVKMSPANSWITNLSIVLELDEQRVNKKFFFYRLGREPLKDKLNTGAAQAQITIDSLRPYTITIPDLPTQERIAGILASYDTLIENNHRRIQLLEQSARLLYKEWFVHLRFPGHEHVKMVDGVPEGWVKGCVGTLAEVKSGYAFKSMDWQDEGNPVIKIKNIVGDGSINVSDCDYVNDNVAESASGFAIEEGALLIAMTGATVGKVGIMLNSRERFYLNQRVGKFSAKDTKGVERLLFPFFQGGYAQTQIRNLAGGAAQPNISGGQIESLNFLIPGKTILNLYLESTEGIFRQRQILLEQNQKLAQARDLLLPRLMNGEIAV